MLRDIKKTIIIKKRKSAQSILEYSMMLSVIAFLIYTMGPILQKTIQGFIKTAADQVGVQANSDQAFDETGHMQCAIYDTSGVVRQGYRERPGVITYEYDDITKTKTQASINMGYTEPSSY